MHQLTSNPYSTPAYTEPGNLTAQWAAQICKNEHNKEQYLAFPDEQGQGQMRPLSFDESIATKQQC